MHHILFILEPKEPWNLESEVRTDDSRAHSTSSGRIDCMNSIEYKYFLLSRVNCVSNSEVRLIVGDVWFNIKPVDKTIAVKYPHFF